jgi:putative cell wall-binding protein
MSKFTFDSGQAVHAVIARSDDFADALAGSALGFGVGPILFTHRSGPLASATSDELLRVLPTGSTVYLLGGSAALPSTLDGEIQTLGYNPVRVAGATRQLTAVAVAEELERFLNANDFPRVDFAVVATAFNWPDAVSAGAIGAYFGAPVLLTSAGSLDPAVRDFLHARSWSKVYVIGGTAAISEDTRRAVRDAAGLASGQTVRLAGADRSSTAVAVAAEYERLFSSFIQQAFGEAAVPRTVVAVNLRRDDGFAHVLSASALLGAQSGVFVPVEGQAGDRISDEAQSYVCRFPAEGVVAGGSDLVSDAAATLFDSLLKGDAPACTGSG